MAGAVLLHVHRCHVAVATIFLVLDPRVLHRLTPFLDVAAGVIEARRALRQVLVLQLQASRQQVDDQRIRYALLGAHSQVHQHQLAAVQALQIERTAVHAQVFALDAEVLATGARGLTRVTGQGQLLIQRGAAGIAHAQRFGQLRTLQLDAGLLVAQFELEGAAGKRSAPRLFRLAENAATGEEQRVALLGRQPALTGQLIGQVEQPLLALAGSQVVLFQQGENQRLVAQRAAVIGHPALAIALLDQPLIQRLLGTRCIAHQLQCGGQLHQRQAGTRIAAAVEQAA